MVFVDPQTLADIEELISDRLYGPLFYGQQKKGISPRTIQHIFKKYAPSGITPHKIRHSYASELYRRSKNLRVVQENLGHASIKTTEVYLHTDLDERRAVYRDYFPLSSSETTTSGVSRAQVGIGGEQSIMNENHEENNSDKGGEMARDKPSD
jgi:integrase/recombinase XerC/integrase/recombinase XerD